MEGFQDFGESKQIGSAIQLRKTWLNNYLHIMGNNSSGSLEAGRGCLEADEHE